MGVLGVINSVISVLFLACYLFQIIYMFIPFVKKLPPHKETKLHKYAVLICARNEREVIPALIDSIKKQDYPSEYYDIFLAADNCTDDTAEVARACGANVYERNNLNERGKGYALDFLLKEIARDFGDDAYDAFVVFDADNILMPNFLTEANKTFSDGYEVVTTYRNSRNYGDNWIAAGSGLWFIRESKYLNGSRMRIGACPQVSGTGFIFSNKIKKENGGWPFHTLTEDYEFTCYSASKGMRFGYCEDARFYDEQVNKFIPSMKQKMRWTKGGIQGFCKNFKGLLKGIFSKNFVPCYDVMMSVAPAFVISMVACVINIIAAVVLICTGNGVWNTLADMGLIVLGAYLLLLSQSILCTATEWKHIHASSFKKILYIFTFPFFLFTFIPCTFLALFKRVEWAHTPHTAVSDKQMNDIERDIEELGNKNETAVFKEDKRA